MIEIELAGLRVERLRHSPLAHARRLGILVVSCIPAPRAAGGLHVLIVPGGLNLVVPPRGLRPSPDVLFSWRLGGRGLALREHGSDGKMSRRTRAALTDYQKAEGLKVTGRLDDDTRAKLGM